MVISLHALFGEDQKDPVRTGTDHESRTLDLLSSALQGEPTIIRNVFTFLLAIDKG